MDINSAANRMNNFRQSLMGRPSLAGRQSFAGRQSLMGRPGSSIPRPTSSTNSNPKLSASDLHLPRSAKEVYHFPLLKLEAIVSCLKDVEVSSTEDELARPTPQKMLLVYETFLDIVTGKLRDDCTIDDIQSMDITAYPVLRKVFF